MAFRPIPFAEDNPDYHALGSETLLGLVADALAELHVCDDCGAVVPYWNQAKHLMRCPPPKTTRPM